MLREIVSSTIAVMVTTIVGGCGSENAGGARRVDITEAGSGGARGTEAGGHAGGAGGPGLVACNDGTGNTDCCPPSAAEGARCDVSVGECSSGCHGGVRGNFYCNANGTWTASLGLFPCRADAGYGRLTQMSCSELHAAWTSFWGSHGACATDADCTTFLAIDPASNPCDNPPGLNRAVSKQFVGEAREYADRYFQAACGGDANSIPTVSNGFWNDFGWDGRTLTNPRCASGSCTAETPSCITPPSPDGGRSAPKDASAD